MSLSQKELAYRHQKENKIHFHAIANTHNLNRQVWSFYLFIRLHHHCIQLLFSYRTWVIRMNDCAVTCNFVVAANQNLVGFNRWIHGDVWPRM